MYIFKIRIVQLYNLYNLIIDIYIYTYYCESTLKNIFFTWMCL